MASFRENQFLVERLINEQISLNNLYFDALANNAFSNVKDELYSKREKINSMLEKWKELKKGLPDAHSHRIYHIDALQMVEQVQRLYILLEQISTREAKSFSDNGRANLRKAKAELQRMRLTLRDITGTRGDPPPGISHSRYPDQRNPSIGKTSGSNSCIFISVEGLSVFLDTF